MRNLILSIKLVFICIALECCSAPQSKDNITFEDKSKSPKDKLNKDSCLATEISEINSSTCALRIYSQIVNPGLLDSFRELDNLKEIKMSNCKIESIEHLLREISERCNLVSLTFYNCNIGQIPDEIKKFKNLRHIEIRQDSPIHAISKEFFKLDQLETVSLSFAKGGSSLLKDLCRIDSLRELELRYCKINTIEQCILSHGKLVKLSLPWNNINKIDVENVFNPIIREIDISNNPMSDRILKNWKKFYLSSEKASFTKHLPSCEIVYYETLDAQ